MKTFTRFLIVSLMLCLLIIPAVPQGIAEASSPVYSAADLFTERDLTQTADLKGASVLTVSDGQALRVTASGVYVLKGTAAEATVYVEAGKDDKVQLVLDGLNVVNTSSPVICIKSADKVWITTQADSSLSVTGAFASDGSEQPNGVLYSKEDLILNGTASLTVSSSHNGVTAKDDLKITGGTYQIMAAKKALDANDSIRVAGGTLSLTAGTDGLHAENNDDDAKGYIYIGGGILNIQAGDDGIHANSVVQIDGGTVSVRAAEGIEGTYVQLNGGTISVQASDDGINAGYKSSAYSPLIEINDGDITVVVGAGDTDGIDSNGSIIVNGGVIRVTGNSTFDCDGYAQYNGGTIIVNGQEVAYIPNQMMGGRGGRGGRGGFGQEMPGADDPWGDGTQQGWGYGNPGGRGGRRGR